MMQLKPIIQITLIFLLETALQIILSGIAIKYLSEFPNLDSLKSIINDNAYSILPIKGIFYLPMYLIYVLILQKRKTNVIISTTAHCIVFLLITISLSLVLQLNLLFTSYSDFISLFLPVIFSSFIIFKFFHLDFTRKF